MGIIERKKYSNFQTTEEFILDKEFSVWVLHPDKEQDHFWYAFMRDYPEKKNLIRDAVIVIKSFQPSEQLIPQQKLNNILQKIIKADTRLKSSLRSSLKYAAGLALLIAATSMIWFTFYNSDQFPSEVDNMRLLKGKIILANGSTREFDTQQTTIKQTNSGNLTINNDTINIQEQPNASSMNQVIIPYGMRSEITLADGTHIWLNSGSQLSYPARFNANSREVYLSGEAFFDVKSISGKPFYVITHDVRIKVVGTCFNVSSYMEDSTTQTVLLKGRVTASKTKMFARTIDLLPGERITYNKTDELMSKDKVDTRLFTSWVNGYLIFDNQPITDVYKKLSRYYNQTIVTGEGIEKITFSGKLDLKGNLRDVLENISFASSVKVFENNGSYLITN